MTTPALVPCPECYGTGKDPIRHNAWCFLCRGKGKMERSVVEQIERAERELDALPPLPREAHKLYAPDVDLADIVGVEEDLV